MATIEVSRKDLHLLRSLALLAFFQPEKKRAAHLAGPAEELARRIEVEVRREEDSSRIDSPNVEVD